MVGDKLSILSEEEFDYSWLHDKAIDSIILRLRKRRINMSLYDLLVLAKIWADEIIFYPMEAIFRQYFVLKER